MIHIQDVIAERDQLREINKDLVEAGKDVLKIEGGFKTGHGYLQFRALEKIVNKAVRVDKAIASAEGKVKP